MYNHKNRKLKIKLNSNLNFEIMKKTNFFKIVMTLVLAFVVTGAGAQLATVNTDFEATPTDYVTVGGTLPYYVQPDGDLSPDFDATASLTANVNTTFTWTFDGSISDGDVTADDNYVELQWGTTGVKTITVTETADAAYGGCSGELKTFFTEVIDIPYVEFNNGADGTPAYTIGGSAINVILSECESVGTTIDPTLEFGDNADEEFPYYIRLNYTVHNATIDGSNNITLDAAETMPAAVDIQGDIAASTVSGTNPLIVNSGDLTGTTLPLLGGASAFPTVNNDITVYVLNMSTNGYNAKISRKSDYVAMRDNGGTPANWDDGNYSWYTDDNSGANELDAYIVILPAPQTGPIYHIPNSWGL